MNHARSETSFPRGWCLAALLFVTAGFDLRVGFGAAWAHGNHDEQVRAATEAISARPRSAEGYLRRAEIHRLDRHWGEAEDDLTRAARLEPGHPGVRWGLAALRLDQGRPSEALAELDRAPRITHSGPTLLLRARSLAALGRPIEAARAMDSALSQSTRVTPDHYLERCRWLVAAGETHRERALAGLNEGVARLGAVVSIELAAIEIETQLGRYDDALARIERLDPQFDRKEMLLALRGDVLRAAGRAMEAASTYTDALDAIASHPGDASPRARQLEHRVRDSLRAIAAEGGPR